MRAKTWGHRIEPVAPIPGLSTCTHPKCKNHFTWRARYRYVTGRAGRTSERKLYLCDAHARAFCEKHKIEGGPAAVAAASSSAAGSSAASSSTSSAEDGEGPHDGHAR